MKPVNRAYLVQWIHKTEDYETIMTRVMITTDIEKIFKKYPDLKRGDVNEIRLGWRSVTVETI